MRRFALAALFFVALVAAWQGMVLSGRWSPVLLPSPGAVGEYLWRSLWDGTLIEAIGVTLRRLLMGYTIGIVLGLPLGLLHREFVARPTMSRTKKSWWLPRMRIERRRKPSTGRCRSYRG